MSEEWKGMDIVQDDELMLVHGMGLISWAKRAGRWIKKHIRVTKKSISVKGEHDIGGG